MATQLERIRRVAGHLANPQGRDVSTILPQLVSGTSTSRNENMVLDDEGSSKERNNEYADDARAREEFELYCREREAAAMNLGNRGPLRFQEDGSIHRDIVDAYFRCGFYVLEGVIKPDELQDLQTEFESLMENAPSQEGSTTDIHGRLVEFPRSYSFVPALSDPVGGTNSVGGRFTMKMHEPTRPKDSPAKVVQNITHWLEIMHSGARVYGHPGLLKVAEAINGPDFTPFTENLFYKQAGLGPSVAWHQDPLNPDWSPGRDMQGDVDRAFFGFSFHVSLYNCTAGNGLWMVPGSNSADGRINVAELSAESGCGDRLPTAVPIVCKPGDVYIQSRQALHGSFANVSPEKRCTLQFGFHRRSSVLNARTRDYAGKICLYDDDWIRESAMRIQMAIEARRRKYPHEDAYSYLPFRGREDEICKNSDAKPQLGYWHKDIVI